MFVIVSNKYFSFLTNLNDCVDETPIIEIMYQLTTFKKIRATSLCTNS